MLQDYFLALYAEGGSQLPVHEFIAEMIKFFEQQSRNTEADDYIVAFTQEPRVPGAKPAPEEEILDPMEKMKKQIQKTKESYLQVIESGKIKD